jgi:hypothetical protein
MSEQDLSNVTNITTTESDSTQDNSAAQDNHLLAKLILELQQTPEEYLPNLLFRRYFLSTPLNKSFC